MTLADSTARAAEREDFEEEWDGWRAEAGAEERASPGSSCASWGTLRQPK